MPIQQTPDTGPDVLKTSVVNDALASYIQPSLQATSAAASTAPTSRAAKYATVNSQLYAALELAVAEWVPGAAADELLPTLVAASAGGAHFVASLFTPMAARLRGEGEPLQDVGRVPRPSTGTQHEHDHQQTHPALVAKRMLQLAICLQHLGPEFPASIQRTLSRPVTLAGAVTAAGRIVAAAASFVTNDDELVGSLEGLECLILQGFYHANAGNLRKVWLAFRRGLSLGQLMGIDRPVSSSSSSLRSANTVSAGDRRRGTTTSPRHLWYRAVFCDRYLSLLLGLRAGTRENDFLDDNAGGTGEDTAMERLEKLQTALSGRIIERNHAGRYAACTHTLAIDHDLEMAAQAMGAAWWTAPTIESLNRNGNGASDGGDVQAGLQLSRLMLQINHYSLAILLHLPYMLRDPASGRFDYNRATCMRAGRAVLLRFLVFRGADARPFSCRHVDYSALIAAMTLELAYLGMPRQSDSSGDGTGDGGGGDVDARRQRADDKTLVQRVAAKMEEIARLSSDRLSSESAEIIRRLLPIMDRRLGSSGQRDAGAADSHADGVLRLNVPYLGRISIDPTAAAPRARGTFAGDGGDGGLACTLARAMHALSVEKTMPPFTGGNGSGDDISVTMQDQQQQHAQPWPLYTSGDAPQPPLLMTLDTSSLDVAAFTAMSDGLSGGNWLGLPPTSAVQGADFFTTAADATATGTMDNHINGTTYGDDGLHLLPGLTAEADDWAFQGVDTTYWASLMLNEGPVVGIGVVGDGTTGRHVQTGHM